MTYFLRLFCCLLFLGIASCATQKNTLNSPESIKQCKVSCLQRYDSCKQTCTNNCAQCSATAGLSALKNYSAYVHEEQVEGGSVDRGLNSYRDPLQCRKVTCNCYADLSICNQACTGIIQKRLQAVPNCT